MAWQVEQRLAGDLHGVEIDQTIEAYVRLATLSITRNTATLTFDVYASREVYDAGRGPFDSLTLTFGAEASEAGSDVVDPETGGVLLLGSAALPAWGDLLAQHPDLAAALSTAKRRLYELSRSYMREFAGADEV